MKTLLIISFSCLALALGGMHPAAAPKRPHVVFVTGDHEYSSEQTMPALAAALAARHGMRTTVLKSAPDENAEENIPGMEALAKADLAVLFLRWRRLPAAQLEHLQKYLDAGKPVVGFRTTTHAFNYPKGHELERWNAFAADYLGGPPGWGGGHYHYGHTSSTDVTVAPGAEADSILTGIERAFHVPSWLYHVRPNYPPANAKLLLMGHTVTPEKRAGREPVDNPVAWTWTNRKGGRVFFTTLGHPGDFEVEAVQRLAVNGIHWALGMPVPKKWAGKIAIHATYHGIRPTAEKK
jgi:type 1 glutamine amidotransferase